MSTTNSNDDVVSHAINAAEANAEDSQSKQQIEELSSMLQSATDASDEENTSQE